MNYNFKVIAEIKSDLSDNDKKFILEQLSDYQQRFNIIKADDGCYYKDGIVNSQKDDFGPVTFFFCVLEHFKNYFSKLEYYDYTGTEVAITKW